MIVSSTAADAPRRWPVSTRQPASAPSLFEGHAYSHNDVAAWLNSLAKQKGYTQPYFSDSTVAPLGSNDHAVKFTSQVTVTDDALSGRYTEKAGN